MTPSKKLLKWYEKNYRDFPWRQTKDPYKIWISEVMLQQTRAKAVLPYYKNFLKSFPTIEDLAQARQEDLMEAWSGLGYYSRARNLHKAAKILALKGFPKDHKKLLELPGFGPYTARAVASFAFRDDCAVLDGNVIRFLSRFYAWKLEWWKAKERSLMQKKADEWIKGYASDQINQALIEIGATICTSQSAACMICPLSKECKGRREGEVYAYPLKKKKRKEEYWSLKVFFLEKDGLIGLQKNHQVPFLKEQFLCPVKGKKIKSKPQKFDFQHAITHHKIFVSIVAPSVKTSQNDLQEIKWIKRKDLKKISPFSLMEKVMDHAKDISTN